MMFEEGTGRGLRRDVTTIKVALVGRALVRQLSILANSVAAFFEQTTALNIVSVFPKPITSATMPPRHNDRL